MNVRTFGLWTIPAVAIARTYLAVTLLLSACVGVSHFTFYTGPVFLFEFLLGIVIAAGCLMRYAAACVLLGIIAIRLLARDLNLILPDGTGATAAVLIASGILLCFGHDTGTLIGALTENNKISNTNQRASPGSVDIRDVQVTIRLEDVHCRSGRECRCVVTAYEGCAGATKRGQEAWYAKEVR